MKLGTDRAEEEGDRGAPADAILLMGAVAVVVAEKGAEEVLEGHAAGEVPPTKGHSPVLLQARTLQTSTKPLAQACSSFVCRFRTGDRPHRTRP
jgi:hypothetical protein